MTGGSWCRVRRTAAVALVAIACCSRPSLLAQSEPAPSFTLATSHVFTTRERPALTLIYRGLDRLDFRVYKVREPFAFFAGLRDPHHLGSDSPVVAQEPTWLERIAAWKSRRRADALGFVRGQFSHRYRRARSEQRATQQVAQRRTSNVNTFAQVPLLNASQLVTSWREHLPRMRDAEYRRVPLDISSTGVYVVEAVNAPRRAYTVVVVSDIGLVTKTAPSQLLVFAANRFTGIPEAGCRVQVIAGNAVAASGTTGSDGVMTTAIRVANPDDLISVGTCNGQTAATDLGGYTLREPTRQLLGYIYTDRPVYRPGHVVNYKSVLRWRERGVLGRDGLNDVEVSVVDGREKVLVRERKTLDEFGALTGSFPIPQAAALGYYTIRVAKGEDVATESFEVQEYRKPEFDVSVTPATRLELQGRQLPVTISARYYFGQPVAGATVRYVLHRQSYYSPLRYDDVDEGTEDGGFYGGQQELEGTARLNDQGVAQVNIPLEVDDKSRDYVARIEARVTDAGDREVSGAGSAVATYGRFLLIARTDRYVYGPGAAAAGEFRALRYDGTPEPNAAMHVTVERWDYRQRDDNGNPRVTVIEQADVTGDADGRAQWRFTTPSGGADYRLRVSAPSEGRTVTDVAYFWITGSRTDDESEFSADRYLELIADRKTYAPGETARLVVRGGELNGSVLVTKETQYISWHQVVPAKGTDAIEVPVTADDVGDVYVSIAFLSDDRLHRAERRLSVPATEHQLTVTATADKGVMRPGEPGTYALKVVDSRGQPVRAQLSVGVVDEAIYGVRPDRTPDPLRFFYRREYNQVATTFSRDYPFVGYSGTEQLLLARQRRPMTLADFKADRPDRPRVRKDFPDTALWAGTVTTGADGTAQVKVTYPDSLTTWRLTARAVTTGTDVGTATAHTLTTKDLIVRVVAPRFLTEGDRVNIPTVVHNYLASPATVALSMSADGLSAADPSASSSRSLTVGSNGEERVDWPFVASQVRPVTLTSTATSAAAGDAVRLSLPVRPAGLQRDTGNAGSIVSAGERTVSLAVPPTANAAGRSVRVSLSPSLAGAMFGALDYLTSFPYGCTEQTLSSFVPNLAVMRALGEMKLTATERLALLDRQVADGLARLYDYQHRDGGWGWWKTDQNDPFMTAYALDGLLLAQENKVYVETWRMASAARALAGMYAQYPRMIPDLKAYLAYNMVRAEAAKVVQPPGSGAAFDAAAALDELWPARARMTASGRAILLMTLDVRKDARGNELARELLSSAETRGDVSWWPTTTDPFLDGFVDTTVEATALALKALAARDPGNAVLERAARWLMLNRTGDYWVSTKQTALALHGLLAYMRARGEKPEPFTADVYVNGSRVATRRFDAASLVAPNPVLVEAPAQAGANAVRIVKQGGGALYYEASVRYYDKPAAADHTGSRSLAITRTYSTLTPVRVKDRIVYREGTFDGTARAGDLLLVRLTAAGARDWRYLMIDDPIPAGTEPVEKEASYELEKPRRWFWGSQRELRDDHVAFFLSEFAEGRYEFSYLLRVTTPGVFNAMPARITPMYVPAVEASSPSAMVSVTAGAAQ